MAKTPRATRQKAEVRAMSDERRLEVAAQFTDDVLSKLADAFFQVVQNEGWGKRDLAAISGINETAINHILAGRRKNLTIDTIALLTRAMQKRPELLLHNLRPTGNNRQIARQPSSAAKAYQEGQTQQPNRLGVGSIAGTRSDQKINSLVELEGLP